MAENSPENQISAPPTPDIAIRTMASDIAAIKAGGGQIVGSTIVSAGIDEGRGRNIGGNVFKPQGATSGTLAKSDSLKSLIIIVGIVVIAGAAALFGYFVLFPWLFKR